MSKLSIITINLDNCAGLQRTIDSVFSQSMPDFEYIIIDGESTDGSTEVIKKNSGKLTYWISEKDKGIYNAMNKGIKVAKGDYLIFLNSGDTFYESNTLRKIAPFLNNTDLVYGNILIKESAREWVKYYSEKLSFEYFTRDTLPHQGTFIKKELFTEIGLYDETLKIVSDWKFFLEAVCSYNVATLYINQLIAIYDYSGISSRTDTYTLQSEEKKLVMKDLFPLFIENVRELQELREKKTFYDSFSKDFFVQKYFALKLKARSLKRKFKI